MDPPVDLGPESVYYFLEQQGIRVWLFLLGVLCLWVAWTARLMVWSVCLCISRCRNGANIRFRREVLITRFGERHRLTKQCSSLRNTANYQTKPLCSICAEYRKDKKS